MTEEQRQDTESVTRTRPAFTVAASQLNAVKFEFAVVLCLGVAVWLLHGWLASSVALQFVLLLGYGLIGMLWVILRARHVLNGARADVAKKVAKK